MTRPADPSDSDHRALALLLDLEYFQAEFYSRAIHGTGLSGTESGLGEVLGGRRVEFANPLVEAFVRGAATEERNHVKTLRDLIIKISGEAPSAPAFDLKSSFTRVAREARLCTADETFDPFLSEANLLMAAYIFEDVAASAYLGSLSLITDPECRALLAGIMAVEASQSAIVRLMLLACGLGDQSNAISLYRQHLCQLFGTVYQGGDHGVGTLNQPSVTAADSRSTLMPRSPKQCRQILCGNEDGLPGLFFPERLGSPAPLAHLRFQPRYARSLAAAAADGNCLVISHQSVPVELPSLPFSEESLSAFNIRENISAQPWTETSYASYAPYVIALDDAIVHGSVGIVAVDDAVIDETLWHTDPRRHRYKRDGTAILLDAEHVESLDGVAVSVLVGAAESYWHSLIDSTARISLVPDEIWQRASWLLLPATGIQQVELARLFRLPAHVSPRIVQPIETLRVETLIYPSSLCGVLDYHPNLVNQAFDRLAGNVPEDGAALPKRIYVDRRTSPLRRLVNEDEVVAALPSFTPVRLEGLPIEQQIRLFAQAEIVVAPHGAGLANLGFVKAGGIVVELMMDTYCMWCYRRLAAVRGLHYLPVLGRSLEGWTAERSVHQHTWTIAVDDVLAAVEQAETLSAQRAM